MRTTVLAIFLSLPVLTLPNASESQSPSQPAVSDAIRTAQEVLLTAFPEFSTSRPSLVIGERGSDIDIVVGEVLQPFGKDSARAVRTLLSTSVGLDVDGSWRSFVAAGPFVRSADYEVLRARVRSLPFQSAAEAQAYLSARGARSGPAQPVPIDAVDKTKWGELLKGNVSVQVGTFQWTETKTTGETEAMPGWVASVSRTLPSGSLTSYTLLLDPFTGRIIRITRDQAR